MGDREGAYLNTNQCNYLAICLVLFFLGPLRVLWWLLRGEVYPDRPARRCNDDFGQLHKLMYVM